jgi:hypothetical protein
MSKQAERFIAEHRRVYEDGNFAARAALADRFVAESMAGLGEDVAARDAR